MSWHKTFIARSIGICSLVVLLSASTAAVIPSIATAALLIENAFTGTGSLKITLEQEGIKDVVDCTGSTLKGTVSSPADAKAKLSSWTMTGCTASSGGESFGSAAVTVLYSLPAVEALSTNSVKVGPLTVRAEYKVHGSTCKPEVIMGNYNYNYTNGSSTNLLSAKVPHIFGIPEGFPPPECLDGGIGYFEPSFSFTNPQFEVSSVEQYLLRNTNSAGPPDIVFSYGVPGDRPVAGDWNGDGTDTIGFYHPSNGSFHLRNSNSAGKDDISFAYGETEDLPVVGDWNEDGVDTIGVFRPSTHTFYLKNANNGNPPVDYVFSFGQTGDIPIAGDWNKSGTDTIGVYRPSNGTFYLRDTNSAGSADYTIPWGWKDDLPVAGDWNEDGIHTFGLFRPSTQFWYLNDSLENDGPDAEFAYGSVGSLMPIVGDWNASGTDTVGIVH
jgi:hypothetical protein